jgi:hypothetical protein
MKKLAAVLLVLGFGSATAFGGIVEFAPDKVGLMPGESGAFTLTIMADLQFDSMDMVIGSDDVTIDGFTYDPAIALDTTNPPYPGAGFYPNDIWVGGFNNPGVLSGPTMLVGVVDFTVPGAAMIGDQYVVSVDFGFDTLSGVGTSAGLEGLVGEGLVNVIPEPATLGLLALGAIGFVRRRR